MSFGSLRKCVLYTSTCFLYTGRATSPTPISGEIHSLIGEGSLLQLEPPSTDRASLRFFRLDEFAKYDAPAVIDTVLRLTGESGLYWVGNSQGTTVGFMTLAENPAYNSKVNYFEIL